MNVRILSGENSECCGTTPFPLSIVESQQRIILRENRASAGYPYMLVSLNLLSSE